jgi:hypothetical protein
MKAIKTFAITLLASLSLSNPLIAGSADFAGIYGGIQASIVGASVDGTHTSSTDNLVSSNIGVNKGGVGKVIPIAGFEAGFNLPLGDVFFLGIGAQLASGSGTLAQSDEDAGEANISIEARDAETWYIQPSVSLFDNSAMYVKWGTTAINLEAVGDVTKAAKFDLDGDMYGIGMLTQFNSGIYIRSEASATSFDQFKITGVGQASTAILEGNPTIAQGSISLGFKF